MAFTFFFRDRHTLEQLTNHLAPSTEGFSKIKVWDAGCAMGPEPYTFAIILAEKLGRDAYSKKVNVMASDIDESSNFQQIVTNGVYPKSDLSRMPENIFENYFSKYDENGNFIIDPIIKNSVQYVRHDLLTLQPIDKNFNAIICKNVLLHFQQAERIEVFKMFHAALIKDGFLTTEQTQAMPEECSHLFKRVVSDANVYQKIG